MTQHEEMGRSGVSSLLQVVAQEKGAAVSRAIARLLNLENEMGLVSILACYHHFPASARDEIASYSASFSRVLSHMVSCGDEQTRFNCIEFISRADLAEYTSLLGEAACDSNREVVEQAVSVIQSSVRGFLVGRGQRKIDGTLDSFVQSREASNAIHPADKSYGELKVLTGVLAKAIESLDLHGRGDVLDTMVRMGSRGDKLLMQELRAALGKGKARRALTKEMRERPRVATVLLVFSMLESGSAVLRRMAEELLQGYASGPGHALLLDTLESKGPDQTRLIVRRLRDIPWLSAVGPSIVNLSADLVNAWVTALDEARMDLTQKLTMLGQLVQHGDETIVKRVFAVITKHYTPSIRPMLIRLAESGEEAIRFYALAALSQSRFNGRASIMKNHLRSDSGRIRALAIKTVASDQFDKLLRCFDQLDERGRKAFAKLFDPSDTNHVAQVLSLLQSPESRIRLRGLRVIRAVGIIRGFEAAVLELARDSDNKVRSYASRMLAALKTQPAARIALMLLGDRNHRVKANAIETVEEFGNAVLQRALTPFLTSQVARVRANAAKAIYGLGSPLALRILEHMGSSQAPALRISSVWALANIKEKATLRQAFDIAKYEHDRTLQRRMLRMIDDAEDQIRQIEYQESQKLLAVAA